MSEHLWAVNMLKGRKDCLNLHGPTFVIFFYHSGFCFTNIHDSRAAGEGGGYLCNSSLPLPPASQTLRHQLGAYCRELTSAHSWQLDSNREPLVSERKSLTTELRGLKIFAKFFAAFPESK